MNDLENEKLQYEKKLKSTKVSRLMSFSDSWLNISADLHHFQKWKQVQKIAG